MKLEKSTTWNSTGIWYRVITGFSHWGPFCKSRRSAILEWFKYWRWGESMKIETGEEIKSEKKCSNCGAIMKKVERDQKYPPIPALEGKEVFHCDECFCVDF